MVTDVITCVSRPLTDEVEVLVVCDDEAEINTNPKSSLF